MIEPGDVIRFYYKWAREHDQGEESGRKARPVCLVMRIEQEPPIYFLSPITTQRPEQQDVTALEIPSSERRWAGLDKECWLILSEMNTVNADRAYDFAGTQPIGRFSKAFTRKIFELGRELALQRKARLIRRI